MYILSRQLKLLNSKSTIIPETAKKNKNIFLSATFNSS